MENTSNYGLKRWDGGQWIDCGSETDLSQYYTKTEMDTRLEQTESGIAALSNRITTTAGDAAALAARLEQAELKITPEAITSAVRETGLYQYDAYEGRNYLRSSGDTLTFTNGNLVENGEETSRRYVTLPFSQDLFEHSGNASGERTSPWAAITASGPTPDSGSVIRRRTRKAAFPTATGAGTGGSRTPASFPRTRTGYA